MIDKNNTTNNTKYMNNTAKKGKYNPNKTYTYNHTKDEVNYLFKKLLVRLYCLMLLVNYVLEIAICNLYVNTVPTMRQFFGCVHLFVYAVNMKEILQNLPRPQNETREISNRAKLSHAIQGRMPGHRTLQKRDRYTKGNVEIHKRNSPAQNISGKA